MPFFKTKAGCGAIRNLGYDFSETAATDVTDPKVADKLRRHPQFEEVTTQAVASPKVDVVPPAPEHPNAFESTSEPAEHVTTDAAPPKRRGRPPKLKTETPHDGNALLE